MNFKDSLNALHTLDSLLQENPVEVCKVYCAHKGLEEPCENTEECLCERFGEDYKSNCSNEYCAEDKYAALNEDNQICSTNDLTELCEIKELAQDFIAHFDEYMNTCKSKLSIGAPEVEGQQCPTEDCKKNFATKDSLSEEVRLAKIKDALINIPDDVLLKIIMNYNNANGYAQVYQNTPENLAKLEGEGFTPNRAYNECNEYCQPTQNGGIESYDNPMQNVAEAELVPYIDENFDEYAEDLNITSDLSKAEVEEEPIEAEESHLLTREEAVDLDKAEEETPVEDDNELIEDAGELDEKWFNNHWTKVGAGVGRRNKRIKNVENFIAEVKKNSPSLAVDLEQIFNQWKNDRIDYSTLKDLFLEKFNTEKALEGDEATDAKKKVVEIYNNLMSAKYGDAFKTLKMYSELPQTWRDKFDDYIARGRVDLINAALKKSTKTSTDLELEEEGKEKILSPEEKTSEFYALVKNILEIDFTNAEEIKKAAEKHEINSVELKSYIDQTKDAVAKDKVSLAKVKKWLYLVARDFYQIKNAEWLRDASEEEEEKDLSTLVELDYEVDDKIKETDAWKKFAPIIARRFKAGSDDYKKYMGQLIKTAKEELAGKSAADLDEEVRPLTEEEFIKLFEDTKVFKDHQTDVEPLLKALYAKAYAKIDYVFAKNRFAKPELNNLAFVLENCLNTDKLTEDVDYTNFLAKLKNFCNTPSAPNLGKVKVAAKLA